MNTKNYTTLEETILEELKNWKDIVKQYQTSDSTKAWTQICTSFIPYIGIWILMYFSLSVSYWLTASLGIVNAFFLVRIFIIQHDCGHQSFFKRRKWNDRLGLVCSVFSTLPYKYWGKTHNYHHGHTGQLEERNLGDINFLTVKEYQQKGKWGKRIYRLFRHPIFLFVIVPTAYFAVLQRLPTLKLKGWSKKVHWTQLYNNLLIVVVYMLLGWLLGWQKFFGLQLIVVLMFSIVAFWFFYVQHQHEYGYMRWKNNWNFLLSSIRGATYYKLPKLFQWLTGNIGLHHIHHLSSRIPNYYLQKCLIENPSLTKHVNIVTFWDSIKMATNKLWDEKSQRMISFSEYHKISQAE